MTMTLEPSGLTDRALSNSCPRSAPGLPGTARISAEAGAASSKTDPLFLGSGLPDGESLGRDLRQINGDELLLFALSSGQAEQTVNYMLKSLSFRPSGIEWFSRIIGDVWECFCGLVESKPQCRQWCFAIDGRRRQRRIVAPR